MPKAGIIHRNNSKKIRSTTSVVKKYKDSVVNFSSAQITSNQKREFYDILIFFSNNMDIQCKKLILNCKNMQENEKNINNKLSLLLWLGQSINKKLKEKKQKNKLIRI